MRDLDKAWPTSSPFAANRGRHGVSRLWPGGGRVHRRSGADDCARAALLARRSDRPAAGLFRDVGGHRRGLSRADLDRDAGAFAPASFGLADAMVYQAIEQFLPVGVAGALLAVMLGKFAPETLWMLPGLWQILVSLGIFASVRSLPRTITLGGAWYFVAGFACLLLASQSHALSPWSMGVPFVIGQLLMAAILHFASGGSNAEN